MIFQKVFTVFARREFYAALLSFSCAVGLAAERDDDSSPSVRSASDPNAVDEADLNRDLARGYFRRLDNLVASLHVDLSRETPEKLAELADDLLADMTYDVPVAYLRVYLAKEARHAAPLKKEWIQRLFDRANELRAMDIHRASATALIRESARLRRVSTLLVCLSLFAGKERAQVAEALADFKESRVIRFLCKELAGASWGSGLVGDNGQLELMMFQNTVIKSLSTLTGLNLTLMRPPVRRMLDDEDEKQFSARIVARIHEGDSRCLDAAVRVVQWLKTNDPRAATMFETDCAAAPRPLTTDGFSLQRAVYFNVTGNLIIVSGDGNDAADALETANRQEDKLLARILEVAPLAYVRGYLTKVVPQTAANTEKGLSQRLLDRLDAIRAMDGASARALIIDSARQRHISTLLVCFSALRDFGPRGEAAKALAGFKEPRVVRCLCTVLAVMAHCASAEDDVATLDNIALQNAAIRSLSKLTGLDLALVDPPPGGMRGGEGEKAFAARLAAARRDRRDCCLNAARRCEKWLDELQRQDSDSRE